MFQVERDFEKKVFHTKDIGLPYRSFVPNLIREGKKYPLLLFLHGAGERGTDNTAQLKHVVWQLFEKENAPCREAFVLVPQCPEGSRWVDVAFNCGKFVQGEGKLSTPALDAAIELVRKTAEENPIDPDHIYVMGISMGGYGTWYALSHSNGLFAGGIPICGGGDPAWASELVPLAIHAFHSSDDGAVPVIGSRTMVDACQKAGCKRIRYTEYNYTGHGSWITAAETPGLIEWLFAQTKA